MDSEHELICQVENLWDIECRHLLGALSPGEYWPALLRTLHAQPLVSLLAKPGYACEWLAGGDDD